MGVATLSETGGLKGLIFAVWIDPKLPGPRERALSGLRRLVAILETHLDYPVVHTARAPLAASDAADLPRISTGLAARGFDEPALRAFLGANRLRRLEAVLP